MIFHRLVGLLHSYGLKCSEKTRYEGYRRKYHLPSSFMFSGYSTFFLGDGEIVIGEDTYLGDHGHIGTVEGSTVKIGRKCRLGSFLEIRTVNSVANQDFSREELDSHVGDVCIGDFVWTGSHVFIREGVTIGDNVVVGAYSVVTHSFPSDVVVAGCPARIIRKKEYD